MNINENKTTCYPNIDLTQSKEAKFFERNPIIPSINIITRKLKNLYEAKQILIRKINSEKYLGNKEEKEHE